MPLDILISSQRVRRKKSAIRAGFVLLGIFIFTGAIISFFYIPKFRINEISINGVVALDTDRFKTGISDFLKGKFFGILPYNNIFILPEGKTAANILQEFPVVKNVFMERNFPQKITVTVQERNTAAVWCLSSASTTLVAERCAFVDESGFIFQPSPIFSGEIFLKFFDRRQEPADIGKKMMPPEQFRKLVAFKDLLAQKGFDVAGIVLSDENEIYEIYLKEGWKIFLNSENESNSAFNNLEFVLEEKIKDQRPNLDYIDLRFGNKVVYKLK